MKNKAIILATFLLAICFFTSCGDNGVSESQLKKDIKDCQEIQEIFDSEYVSESKYELTKCEITKAQLNLENKEHIIYCDLVIENEYFTIPLTASVIYNYYDTEGWIIEEKSFEKVDVVAKKAPEPEKIKSPYEHYAFNEDGILLFFYNDKKGLGELSGGEFSIVSCDLNKDKKSSTVMCKYKSACVSFKGSFEITLDSEKGWFFKNTVSVPTMIEYTSDFSSATGEFIWKYNEYFIKLSISQITDNYAIYTLDSNLEEATNDLKYGTNIKAVFDSKSGHINMGDFKSIRYNLKNDTWIYGNIVYEFKRIK